MKYNKKKAHEQINSVALKSKKLPVGTELTVLDIVPGTMKQKIGTGEREVANDVASCITNEGKRIRVPMRELLRFQTADKKEIHSVADAENIEFPDRFKIVSSSDRRDRKNEIIYPIQAYKLGQDFLEGKEAANTWDKVVAGGLRDGHNLDPVQDYAIAAL
jgi:hypothetical protein